MRPNEALPLKVALEVAHDSLTMHEVHSLLQGLVASGVAHQIDADAVGATCVTPANALVNPLKGGEGCRFLCQRRTKWMLQ